MSVSVSMPQLGESVTEGTVTRWLKKEGERVEADEPLLEVSTDKVDTEIPSPVAGILRGITVAEDETVAVGAELAVIDEEGAAPSPAPAGGSPATGSEAPQAAAPQAAAPSQAANGDSAAGAPADSGQGQQAQQPYQQQGPPPQQQPYQQVGHAPPAYQPPSYPQSSYQQQPPAYPPQGYQQPPSYQQPPAYPPSYPQQPAYEPPAYPQQPAAQQPEPAQQPYQPAPQQPAVPAQSAPPAPAQEAPAQDAPAGDGQAQAGQTSGQPAAGGSQLPPSQADGPYVTPLVRKLAAEHGIDLASVAGTGVGGRIRKQDVLDAAREGRGSGAPAAAAQPAAPAQPAQPSAPAQPAQPAAPAPAAAPSPAQAPAAQSGHSADGSPAGRQPAADNGAAGRPAIVPSSLRGTTVQMSRARQVIAKRMVESLHVSAQLTTVVEADVTEIARLRERAKTAFESREGVKLSFLPFFALAAVEALKVHPRLNAVIDTESAQVTYHDAEHLGIAVDTDRGLMVPVIRQAGDLNIGGLARKIADLAERTRSGRVSPDDLSGGTFTLTNTGSRGALFDTPIINQPQVAILGTGTVVKRPVVVEDPALGEVITVRSMVYLALTYDHRLVDGADAARFLVTMKARLEEGAFETELGL
jgi:pyruvate dehydrogenase E2 component (dihydrolipoamide acetyltransferase)